MHHSILLVVFDLFLLRLSIGEETSSDVSNIFNTTLINRLQSDYEQMGINGKKMIRHKIGVLGVYYRIFKRLINAGNDETGYLYRFPDVIPRLDMQLSKTCEIGLEECMSEMLLLLKTAHPWLYPDETDGKFETQLNSAVLKDIVGGQQVLLETSAIQMLCFFTIRRLTAFKHIPFCRFRLNDNTKNKNNTAIWPGYQVRKSPQMIDELLGKSYECAYESFCPDPCCHGVQSTSPLFLSRACSLNKCLNKNRCKIEPEFNDDFQAIRNNRWNITCPCGKGLMYRSDVETCVHADLCSESDKCPPSFDCVNTVTDPGYKCVCQLGFIRNDFDKCIPTGFSSAQWHGFAFTEPHPQLCIRNSIFISIFMSFMLILPQ